MVAFRAGIRLGPRTSVQAGPQPYSPADEGGLVAWIDMLDQTYGYTLNASGVTGVCNKATGTWWGLGTATPVPFDPLGINGRPALHSTGNIAMRFQSAVGADPSVVAAMTDSAIYTLIWVSNFDLPDTAGCVFGAANSGFASSNRRYFGQNTTGSGRMISQTINSTPTTVSAIGTAQAPTSPAVHAFQSSAGTTVSNWINGDPDMAGTAQAPGTLTVDRVGLFCVPDSNPDTSMQGALGELLLFNTALSQAALDRVVAWMMVKWGFTPASLPGLVGWFDMQDAASFTQSGGFVQTITNKATGVVYNTAQSVLPGYNASGQSSLNGRPAMSFDGATQAITGIGDTALLAALTGGVSYSVCAAVQAASVGAMGLFLGAAVAASGNGFLSFGQDTANWTVSAKTAAGTTITVDSTAASNVLPTVYEAYSPTTTTVSMQFNGAAADPSGAALALGALGADNIAIGCRPKTPVDGRWSGRVGEITVYNRLLSSGERAFIRAYQANRWGIQAQ